MELINNVGNEGQQIKWQKAWENLQGNFALSNELFKHINKFNKLNTKLLY